MRERVIVTVTGCEMSPVAFGFWSSRRSLPPPPAATQVFLAKRRHDAKYYAIKVLQKRVILNRKEVTSLKIKFQHLRSDRVGF